MKKNSNMIKILMSMMFLVAIVVLANTYYKEKENEENIYLNNGIDETAENSDSVNEEVQYVDIISLGNLIIHQSQIDGAKQENSYDFSPSFQYIKKMILDSDISMGILEGALAGCEPSGYPFFNSFE